MLYDKPLETAVREFQRSHGLEADGLVGKAALAALNIQPSQRIEQIRANLERWRWMPETLGRRHVRVNIANFRLEAWQEGRVAQSMKVIVGRPYRQTPLFSDNIRYLVFNPTWEVPLSIAVKDKLPLFRKDPGSLRKNGFVLLRGYGAAETEIDPATVDWTTLNKHNFPFRLRQKPGRGNALGKVKIMFPNQHDVYLHDTSNPELFARGVRTFSSGCIRVAQPLELSQWLLNETPGWSSDAVAVAWQRDETKTVLLKEAVPIHLQYATVQVDSQGEAQFLPDVYQRDAPLIKALQRRGPEQEFD
jgi:murein L,D-transpeptidase YcbB/YkuD